jgi:membrane protein YqaA with SNARE-associated domain
MKDRLKLYHRFLKFKGIYTLAWQSILKLIIIVAIIAMVLVTAQHFITDFKESIEDFIKTWDTITTLTVFFISESLLGLIPPDFFIAWSSYFSAPVLMLSILAVLSYIGGINAFFIGRWVRKFPKINRWLEKRFAEHFDKIKRYGAFLIVFSALFPLPYSTVSMVAGMVNYPTKPFLILGLSRLLRFYIYALALYQVV